MRKWQVLEWSAYPAPSCVGPDAGALLFEALARQSNTAVSPPQVNGSTELTQGIAHHFISKAFLLISMWSARSAHRAVVVYAPDKEILSCNDDLSSLIDWRTDHMPVGIPRRIETEQIRRSAVVLRVCEGRCRTLPYGGLRPSVRFLTAGLRIVGRAGERGGLRKKLRDALDFALQ